MSGTLLAIVHLDPTIEILAYLEQADLYGQFRLEESWDSPHNLELLVHMPADFAPPEKMQVDAPSHTTFFQLFVGRDTIFAAQKGLRMPDDFPGGPSKFILVAEAGRPVPWTKPEDMNYERDQPLPLLGGIWKSHIQAWHAVLADGTVRVFESNESEEVIRGMITRKHAKP